MDAKINELKRLIDIVDTLRGPDGCPWDKKQTLYSMRESFLEEAYEVVHALDNRDIENIKEEFGDILLHVMLHARIAEEEKLFSLEELTKDICDKLIRRHPHVFKGEDITDSSAVVKRWEEIKKQEKADRGLNEKESAISKAEKPSPPMIQAEKLQEAAAKVGFDWPSAADVLKKTDEELAELKEACESGDKERIKEETGDLIFALVNLARHYGISAEDAVVGANRKFIRRFHFVEDEFARNGKELENSTLEEMDKIWNIIREQEKE